MTPEDDHQKPSLVLPVIGGYELLEHVIDACAGYACVHEYSSAEELISYQDAHPSTRIPLNLGQRGYGGTFPNTPHGLCRSPFRPGEDRHPHG